MQSPALKAIAVMLTLVYLCSGCSSKSPEQVATINGQIIYEDDLEPAIRSQMQQLRTQEYQLKSQALEAIIQQNLLNAEAKKRGLSIENLLAQEVESKISDPTDAHVQAFYVERKDSLNRPLTPELHEQIRQALKASALKDARSDYVNGLRAQAKVAILLAPPRIEVDHDPSRLRGNPSAPITIVEFSDFECPFCKAVQPTLKQLMAKYEGKVRLSYRDFPLREIHPHADGAAYAARCAGDQGKFWEYHDLLFSDQANLGADKLLERARKLKLDEAKFGACITSNKFQDQIQEDAETGARSGVSGTPCFFINGVVLTGAQPLSAFERIIDAELTRHQQDSFFISR